MRIVKSGLAAAAFITSAILVAAPASARDMARHGGETMLERICAAAKEPRDDFSDKLAKRLKLNDSQTAALKDLKSVHDKSRAEGNAAICAAKPDLSSFAGRLAFHEKSLEAHLATVKVTRPKLEAFWNSLDDAQKKGFARTGRRLGD